MSPQHFTLHILTPRKPKPQSSMAQAEPGCCHRASGLTCIQPTPHQYNLKRPKPHKLHKVLAAGLELGYLQEGV